MKKFLIIALLTISTLASYAQRRYNTPENFAIKLSKTREQIFIENFGYYENDTKKWYPHGSFFPPVGLLTINDSIQGALVFSEYHFAQVPTFEEMGGVILFEQKTSVWPSEWAIGAVNVTEIAQDLMRKHGFTKIGDRYHKKINGGAIVATITEDYERSPNHRLKKMETVKYININMSFTPEEK